MSVLEKIMSKVEQFDLTHNTSEIREKILLSDIEVFRIFLINRLKRIKTLSTTDGILLNGSEKEITLTALFCVRITGNELVVIPYKGKFKSEYRFLITSNKSDTKPQMFWKTLAKVVKTFDSKLFINSNGELLSV